MRVLILSVFGHFGAARVPRVLQAAGFEVAMLAQSGSALTKTRFVDQLFPLPRKLFREPGGRPVVGALLRTLAAWQPDLIMPGDEPSVRLLHQVAELGRLGRLAVQREHLDLLTLSLGYPRRYAAAVNKRAVQDLAASIGLRLPEYQVVESIRQCELFAWEHGFPVVLKRDASYGGHGVAVCADERELRAALGYFKSGVARGKKFKDALRRLIGDEIATAYHPAGGEITIQRFVHGRPGMYTLAAVRGKSMGGFAAVAEHIYPEPTGPSTVVRLIEHSEMEDMAQRLIAELGCTGLAGVDFVIEDNTRLPYVLECNTRPTPVVHLGPLVGVDLGEALFCGLRGQMYRRSDQHLPTSVVVPLFPHEWRRDPSSPLLRQPIHDVPWDDPLLLKAMIAETPVGNEPGAWSASGASTHANLVAVGDSLAVR